MSLLVEELAEELNFQEIAIVKDTFALVEPHGSKFAQDFYDKFFTMSPEVTSLFANVDRDHSSKMIWNALMLIVYNLENKQQLQNTLFGLGRRHMNYGVSSHHYLSMGEAIMATLQSYLEANQSWNEEVAAAWERAYNLVSRRMQKGSGAFPKDINVTGSSSSDKCSSPRKFVVKSSFRLDSLQSRFATSRDEEMTLNELEGEEEHEEEKSTSSMGDDDEENEEHVHELDVQLLRETFDHIKPNGINFVRQFYAVMFHKHPNLHTLFSKIDQSHQEKKLLNILTLIVENIENQDMLGSTLRSLGERHVGFGVIPPYFKHMGEALMEVMEKYFDDLEKKTGEHWWSIEAEESWRSAYSIVAGLLLQGYNPQLSNKVKSTKTDSPKTNEENGGINLHNIFARMMSTKSNISEENISISTTALLASATSQSLDDQQENVSPRSVFLAEFRNSPQNVSSRMRPSFGRRKSLNLSPKDRMSMSRQSSSNTVSSTDSPVSTPAPVSRTSSDPSTLLPTSSFMNWQESFEALRAKYSELLTARIQELFAWFTEAPMWVIVAGTVSTYVVLTRLLPQTSWVSGFVESIEQLSLLIGVVLYLKEAPDRRKQFHYHAWGAIDGAASAKVSQTRIMALQDLNNDGVSLRGFLGEGLDLSEVRLPGADLRQCQLNDARFDDGDLSGADLSYAVLSHASLVKAELSRIRLEFAHCAGANFNGANMEHGNLFCADFSEANLSGVNLRHATLKGVCFDNAVLAGADFTGADVDVRALSKGLFSSTRMPDGTLSPS